MGSKGGKIIVVTGHIAVVTRDRDGLAPVPAVAASLGSPDPVAQRIEFGRKDIGVIQGCGRQDKTAKSGSSRISAGDVDIAGRV